jgi:DNA gyrase/topoisomerase IV subunit B
MEESARTKGMWAGALEPTKIAGLQGAYPREAAKSAAGGGGGPQYELRGIPREHTPALLKIIDEGLVNASDHAQEHAEGPRARRVTRISLTFDPVAGRVVIENDGPGIPVAVHAGASTKEGRPVYVPEVAFAVFLAGRNMEKAPDSVKGGINGIGAKLINAHSAAFTVETVAGGQYYRQAFSGRLARRDAPTIFGLRTAEGRRLSEAQRRPHTRITFVPAYAELGYAPGEGGPLAAAAAADLDAWCRWRMFLLAAYVGPEVAATYNGVRCPTTTARSLAELLVADAPEALILECSARAPRPPYKAHPWRLAVAVDPGGRRFRHVSVINGVVCAAGSHIRHLKKLLAAAIGAKLARVAKGGGAAKKKKKGLGAAEACRQLVLVAVGALPGADWGGQRKDELQVAEARLRPYSLATPAEVERLAQAAAEQLLLGSEKGLRGRKRRVQADKYTGARRAGTRDSGRCSLLAAEGDSAIALLRAGLTLGPRKNPGGPTFEHYGVVSLGGVIMNARKKVARVPAAGGGTAVVRSEALRKNKVLTALAEILGLDYTCRYATPAERARLRYGHVVICTDQDLDGTGKILPLVLVWFHLFWPDLVASGFVQRFMTPVIRAYPRRGGGAPAEFFYERGFEKWARGAGGAEGVAGAYRVKYYKGLAAHDGDEVAALFSDFAGRVYTFTLDPAADGLFEAYFGPRAAPRKAELSTPVSYLTAGEIGRIHASRRIPCSTQLRVDAKAYKLDDIQRKIPAVADGIPVARRKILAGALRRFAASNREVKVFQLGGYVAERMFYHHGDASLGQTIIGMAQRFPGALNFPYLTGVGQFGSRHCGGEDAGSPRYVSVRLAGAYARAMLPAADTWLLPHVFEDGERAQPRHFVPVLPAALLESFEIPSEGWCHRSFARRLDDVLALARAYVGRAADARSAELVARVAAAAERARPGTALAALPGLSAAAAAEFAALFPLRVSLRGYGEGLSAAERAELVRPCKGYLHSFGFYRAFDLGSGRAEIRVSELPLRKTIKSFLEDLARPARAALIDAVDDYSSGARVDVRIRLPPGAWEAIQAGFGSAAVDSVEDFLLLRSSLRPRLNFYGADGRVVECGDDYHAAFFCWAPLRRDLYRARLEREKKVLELRSALERELIRFTLVSRTLALSEMADEAAACAELERRGFARYDAAVISAPRFTPTAEIGALAREGPGAGYDYLLALRGKDLVAAARAKRERRLAEMEERLGAVERLLAERPFAGASVWADEIEAVAEAIAAGEKSGWKF